MQTLEVEEAPVSEDHMSGGHKPVNILVEMEVGDLMEAHTHCNVEVEVESYTSLDKQMGSSVLEAEKVAMVAVVTWTQSSPRRQKERDPLCPEVCPSTNLHSSLPLVRSYHQLGRLSRLDPTST